MAGSYSDKMRSTQDMANKGVVDAFAAGAGGVTAGIASAISTSLTEKALIWVCDEDEIEKKALSKKEMDDLKAQAMGGLSLDVSLPDIPLDEIANVGNLVGEALGVKNGFSKKGAYNRCMEVQFNPASITIRGHAGDDDVQITNYTQEGDGIGNTSMTLQMDMSVTLIFDQINNTAAFQQDMFNFSSSRIASSVGGAIKGAISNKINGPKATIQQIVEAFIATLRNEKTRLVCFEWGPMRYEGMLRQVNTTYTMFDINGNPVRAEVGLSIYLVEMVNSTSGEVLMDYTCGYWYGAYKKAFIDGNLAAMAKMGLVTLTAD